MNKKFKPSFGVSSLYYLLSIFFTFALIAFVVVLIFFLIEPISPLILLTPLACLASYIVFAFFTMIVNCICRLFCKTQFEIEDNYVIYEKHRIRIMSIKSIIVDMGYQSKHYSRPHSITMLYGDKGVKYVKRPSIEFLYFLKKTCGINVYTDKDLVKEFWKEVGIYIATSLVIIVIMIMMTLSGCVK